MELVRRLGNCLGWEERSLGAERAAVTSVGAPARLLRMGTRSFFFFPPPPKLGVSPARASVIQQSWS